MRGEWFRAAVTPPTGNEECLVGNVGLVGRIGLVGRVWQRRSYEARLESVRCCEKDIYTVGDFNRVVKSLCSRFEKPD